MRGSIMENFKVYMYNLPRVSEDGKESIPIDPHRTQEFSDVDNAENFASQNKNSFDRVVLMKQIEEKQEMMMRYIDGQKEVPQKSSSINI
jgi:hypothetical protein